MADERPTADPLGRAMCEYLDDDLGTLRYRDGAQVQDGRVHQYYFRPPTEWADATTETLRRLVDAGGPVLDVGCGAGQHALWLRARDVPVVGVDASPNAIVAARQRGLERAVVGDMFELPFRDCRFQSIHCVGTQLGLAGSLAGITNLLAEFGRVTTEDALAVVDNYDPTVVDEELLGLRPDPRDGIAHRCFHLEYEHDDGTDGTPILEIGPTLHFLLCTPDRLRETTSGTAWAVTTVESMEGSYRAVLEKHPEG